MMKKFFLGIIVASAILSCSAGGGGKVIPRKVFAEIYADMFVADQWAHSSSWQYRTTLDTTELYEPIFRKYGYTADDYIASVDYYLEDPVRYERILQRAYDIITARQEVLDEERKEKERQELLESRSEEENTDEE